MTTFGLVHGAWHGAWCWDGVALELQQRGHKVVAVELPSDDAAATYSTYSRVIVGAMEPEPPDAVLVAHSMAGLAVPIAASRLPLRAVVFVCGLIAVPGRSLIDQFIDQPDMLVPGYDDGLGEPDEQGRSRWTEFESARATLYGDCEEATAAWAFDRLRPQGQATYAEPCPLTELPEVEYAYVLGSEDRLVSPEWSREAAAARLGVTPIELPGGHSPFLARPGALADVLARFA
jgi:pimeloyl-ACP methyl ester carboxylesterase